MKQTALACLIAGILILHTQLSAESKKASSMTSPQVQSQLNLTEQQLAKIQELRNSQQKLVQAKERNLQAAQAEFRKAIRNHASDEELKVKFQALQAARLELSRARFQQMLKLRSVLTEEQQKKFRELKGIHQELESN